MEETSLNKDIAVIWIMSWMMFRWKKRQFNLHLAYSFIIFIISEGEKNKEKCCILEVIPSEQQQKILWFATHYIMIKHDI